MRNAVHLPVRHTLFTRKEASVNDPTRAEVAVVPAHLLKMLHKVDSPTVANAIETFDLRDRCSGFIGGRIGCRFPDLGPMVGQALTVTMTSQPGDVPDRDGYWQMWEALEKLPSPSVLVIADASGAPHRCAFAGEIMATLAKRLGAVGMVTDGGLRDLNEVHALRFHYFMPFPVVSHGNFEIIDVGSPVTIDGEQVRTGDLLHGDANGIVIIPPEAFDDLEDGIQTIQIKESMTLEYIRSSVFTLEDFKHKSGY